MTLPEHLNQYKSAIEALLFVSDKPIVVDQIRQVFADLKPTEISAIVKSLQEEYLSRQAGMVIVDIAGGWQMLSDSHVAVYIREFYKTKTKEKLSRPALETLAIIAYKQPAGRAEVEVIRGVNSDGTVAHLLNKGLIKIVGRKEVPGRPFLYGTTKEFLDYFGLKGLEDLPKIEEFVQLGVDVPDTEKPALPVAEVDSLAMGEPTEQSASQEPSGISRVNEPAMSWQAEGETLPAGMQETYVEERKDGS